MSLRDDSYYRRAEVTLTHRCLSNCWQLNTQVSGVLDKNTDSGWMKLARGLSSGFGCTVLMLLDQGPRLLRHEIFAFYLTLRCTRSWWRSYFPPRLCIIKIYLTVGRRELWPRLKVSCGSRSQCALVPKWSSHVAELGQELDLILKHCFLWHCPALWPLFWGQA